jgi:cytidylate kinase
LGALIVAVDGAAGSGKSTLARSLARALATPYVNTGLMYRALAAAAARESVEVDDEGSLVTLAGRLRFRLGGELPEELEVEGYDTSELTSRDVESTVSAVARHPGVRRWMCRRQRELGAGGAVVEGRDIGTVVFPDAGVKFFLKADAGVRVARRADQRSVSSDDVDAALRARDERDARTTPLEPAADAIVIDSGALGIDETLQEALKIVAARRGTS